MAPPHASVSALGHFIWPSLLLLNVPVIQRNKATSIILIARTQGRRTFIQLVRVAQVWDITRRRNSSTTGSPTIDVDSAALVYYDSTISTSYSGVLYYIDTGVCVLDTSYTRHSPTGQSQRVLKNSARHTGRQQPHAHTPACTN